MKKLHTITLEKTTGTKTIAEAKDVFAYIDSDFKNWNTNKKGKKTVDMSLAVCELTENMMFTQMFPKPEDMCVSQEQIIEFCKEHKDKLQQDWYTFFLFKVNSEFFVADVDVRSGGLRVYVHRFSSDSVWYAECRRRFVIPQLALETLDQTLRPSDTMTLESTIEFVKKEGYEVYKRM